MVSNLADFTAVLAFNFLFRGIFLTVTQSKPRYTGFNGHNNPWTDNFSAALIMPRPIPNTQSTVLSVKSIYLWTPQEQNDPAGQSNSFQLPVIETIPKRELRRLNKLSKIALFSSIQCTENHNREHLATVFCSRHGDINNTLGVFSDIAHEQLVSPHIFSGSVFNMPFAYYSIFFNDKHPSTAVSSSSLQFSFGFLESVLNLNRFKPTDILYTCADLPLEGELQSFNDHKKLPYSISLVLAGDLSSGDILEFHYSSGTSTDKTVDPIPDAFTFYEWYTQNSTQPLTIKKGCDSFTYKKFSQTNN